jgi:peptidoglycan/xylan/chitin deacetylase (PgdA/CDA1 family)
LLFHGVVREQRWQVRNYTRKHMLLARFEEILEDLCRSGTPVSMQQIADCTLSGAKLPNRSFAITFDDGFENNFSIAAPVLERLGIPATFYVTSGFVEMNSSSWIDMIERAVEASGDVMLTVPEYGLAATLMTIEDKRKFLDDVRRLVKNAPAIDPYRFADEVCQQLGAAGLEPDSDLDSKMSWEQLRELNDHPLFDVGGHSHTHRILSYLNNDDLKWEVSTSLNKLAEHVGIVPRHFSYPEGLSNCYSPRVIDELLWHGVICSPSAIHGVNRPGDNLFHLKRLMAA